MRSFSDINEKAGDTAVFTFGRFNPPTTGHEKLIDALAKQQSANSGSKMYVFPSQSQNPKKDPLPFALKVAYMRKMFPKYAKNIIASKVKMVFDIAVYLHNKGHRSIVMVVGSDRVTEFESILNKYNGVNARHGYYGFDNIEVVSAGERDPDAEGVSGMSASKMRSSASDGDFDTFKMGVPSGFKDALKLYNDVRKNMGIREERDMGEMTDFESLRDLYLTGKLWNIGDIVESKGVSGKVINKGTNYLSYVSEDGKVHKTWLYDIVERNYAQEYANYQGTPEQIARRSSRNKARRVMGDKVIQGMDIGHKDNNPMNNDPSNLRNEDPSVNRREPRLREVNDHKKDYETFVQLYTKINKAIDNASVDLKKITKDAKGAMGMIDPKVKSSSKYKIAKANYDKVDALRNKFLKGVPKDFMKKFSQRKEDFNEIKQDKDVVDKKGSQPAKYFAKDADGDAMSKSTKDKRDAHFKKNKTGPAPGDANADTKPSTHTKKFKQMFGEARAKQAVSQGKVQKLVTAHGLKFKGKVYKEIDMELVKINNSTEMVTFNIIHPRELFGNKPEISFKALKRGPFMATDTSKINEDAEDDDLVRDMSAAQRKMQGAKEKKALKVRHKQQMDRAKSQSKGQKKSLSVSQSREKKSAADSIKRDIKTLRKKV